MTGETIKTMLEDVADNLFNPDPYYQQGGDMVRVGGLALHDRAGRRTMGKRIADMRLAGKPIDADQDLQGRRLGAGGRGGARAPGNKPVWDVVEQWLKSQPGGASEAAPSQHADAGRRPGQSRAGIVRRAVPIEGDTA